MGIARLTRPGNRPPSHIPKKKRANNRPVKLFTSPVSVVTVPHMTTKNGIHRFALTFLRIRFEASTSCYQNGTRRGCQSSMLTKVNKNITKEKADKSFSIYRISTRDYELTGRKTP